MAPGISPETRIIGNADNVSMYQLVFALTADRIHRIGTPSLAQALLRFAS